MIFVSRARLLSLALPRSIPQLTPLSALSIPLVNHAPGARSTPKEPPVLAAALNAQPAVAAALPPASTAPARLCAQMSGHAGYLRRRASIACSRCLAGGAHFRSGARK